MSLFPIVDGRARFDASGNVDTDRYSAGIRFTQEGAARSTTAAGTFFNQGIPMSATGQVSLVDASAGLPAGTIYHNGLPMNGDRVCISNKPVAVVSSGIPYDNAGAVAATVAPITNLPTLDLVFAGTATDPLDVASTTDDTLSLNFTAEAYQIAAQYAVWGTGGLQAVNFADIVTFTRASTATYFNSAGTLTTATTNEARFDYDPATLLARGFLIEEARTNSIRNNTMQGAVAGTPGTPPTNWGVSGTADGIAIQIVGTGTENGITYIDIRYSGTATATSFKIVRFEATNNIAAASGQSWTAATYMRIAAGSTANITGLEHQVVGYTAGGAVSEQTNTPPVLTSTMTRFITSRTLNNATTAFVTSWFALTFNNGAVIDLTLRIGLPQLEQGAFATSVIPTTTTALTRSADVASVNTLSPWYNSTAGTLFAEVQRPSSVSNNGAMAGFNDGSTSNRLQTRIDGATTNTNFIALAGAVNYAASFTFISGGVNKAALAYETNNVNSAGNGVVGVTDTSEVLPTGLTKLDLGQVTGAGVLNGYLRRITYYPRRLANADLQTITA